MTILTSEKFKRWYKKLDETQKIQVDVRISRILIDGHFGTLKRIENIFELKFNSGLRIYYAFKDEKLILLLNGGNKNTKKEQSKDIVQAKLIYQEYLDGEQI